MLALLPLPAFSDNDIWLQHNGRHASAVDPGEAVVVRNYLQRHALRLRGVLLTQHHPDHTGGVRALRQRIDGVVHGPYGEPLPERVKRLRAGDRLDILGCRFEVLAAPGHTASHIADFSEDSADALSLFCGLRTSVRRHAGPDAGSAFALSKHKGCLGWAGRRRIG